MQKLFDSDQIRRWDEVTISKGMASIDLMERAAKCLTEAICQRMGPTDSIGILAGVGNNGGDALAVARLLIEKGYESVTPHLICPDGLKLSPDCNTNYLALDGVDRVESIDSSPSVDELNRYDFIIDGLFGSGLSRHLSGIWSELVQRINDCKTEVFSIDLPSGAYSDRIDDEAIAVKADMVFSLQIPKRVFMFPESQRFMTDFVVLDIGLDDEFHESEVCDYRFLETNDIGLPERKKFSHKGTLGHTLLIAGSRGLYGAAQLSARASLRSGVGLLTVHTGSEAMPIIQSTIPEAMFSGDLSPERITQFPALEKFTAIACGPGLGTDSLTVAFIDDILNTESPPMVLDADALNIIAKEGWQKRIPSGSILTPHPKEFDRLFGSSKNSMQAIELQREMAKRLGVVIVRKGAHSSIALPDGLIYFNSTGNPHMARGGMGDILTGLIGGLLGQGLSAEKAALRGVSIHGSAGDRALRANKGAGLSCQDLIEHLL